MIFNDPFTAFGGLSIPLLISDLITVAGFLLATWFAIRYTTLFYERRPLPRSWQSIIAGFVSLSIGEVGGFLIGYRVSPTYFEGASILGATLLGVALIAAGCVQLSREIS